MQWQSNAFHYYNVLLFAKLVDFMSTLGKKNILMYVIVDCRTGWLQAPHTGLWMWYWWWWWCWLLLYFQYFSHNLEQVLLSFFLPKLQPTHITYFASPAFAFLFFLVSNKLKQYMLNRNTAWFPNIVDANDTLAICFFSASSLSYPFSCLKVSFFHH